VPAFLPRRARARGYMLTVIQHDNHDARAHLQPSAQTAYYLTLGTLIPRQANAGLMFPAACDIPVGHAPSSASQ
jgi:hypothetical protein